MKLVCLLEHLRGKEVFVSGVTYQIGVDGKTYVGNQVHAKALLANVSGWMVEPEPLMPLDAEGKPEHVSIPSRYLMGEEKVAPAPEISPYDDPAIVAPPAAEPVDTGRPVSSGDIKQSAANTHRTPAAGVEFGGGLVTPEDVIQAKAAENAPRQTAVSSPVLPASATVAKTSAKKGHRK